MVQQDYEVDIEDAYEPDKVTETKYFCKTIYSREHFEPVREKTNNLGSDQV